MSSLFSSNLMRLKKDQVFWVCFVFMFLFGSILSISVYFDKLELKGLDTACAENVAFGFNWFAGLLCLAFCCLFQSDEYVDGTINNKVIAGHSRTKIYISQVLISVFAGISMCIAYIIPSLIIGIFFLGGFKEINADEITGYYINSFLLTSVCVALYSFISVIVQKKTGSTSLCFLIVCVIVYAAISIHGTLRVPEYTNMFVNGEMIYGLNPAYPDPQEREVLELIYDILPSGQAYQLCYRFAENIPLMIVSNIVMFTVLLLAGVVTFNKKDLK